ncbi:hypothetical protein [Clostridium novyi]|uniref:hypothetical protein n=1 Tax=Clostridium novyi TaxID=1542 RepID=UPI0016513E61|nr:hypothetical protein [Clostridium novyi]
MPRLQVSFKESNRDMQLYTKVLGIEKGERSNFIKHCIRVYFENKENKKVEK